MIGWIIAIAVVVILVLIYFGLYNSLVKYRNRVDETWAQIDVQLKRRFDLIPNLVETVKGYEKHEKETLTQVIEARNKMMEVPADNRQGQIEADNMLSGALKSIFALGEAYPDLKANTSFIELQHELTTTENKVAYSRQLYNTTVMTYNTKVQSVPTNIVAKLHNFTERDMLSIPEVERVAPKVEF
ncbi:LemA family protein [Listeria monocytogenes]|uniref:LemA family protein n=1 Tax=Listeria monocytogenes TaxID=1639 RepID=UPI0023B0278B|nr:LemA family protein [Listeria monocytogenes]MDE8609991.1 LemA family protein [Listeria monocytogenes]